MRKNLESNMLEFCKDALDMLEKYDNNINYRIKQGNYSNFYRGAWNGIGIFSTSETIIKHLIFTNLLDKYRMWPEMAYYYEGGKEDRKLLDLGLYFGDVSDNSDEELISNVAIVMKWAKLTQDGYFYGKLISDLSPVM